MHKQLILVVHLAIAALSSGCPTVDESPVYVCDPATSDTGCEGCVAPSYGAEVWECGLSFCPPESLHLSLRDPVEGLPGLHCGGFGGSSTCSGNGTYQAFEYITEDFWLYLSFGPGLNGDYTTERLLQAFNYTYFEVRMGAPTTHSYFMYQMPAVRDVDFFDTFTVENGKLVGSFTVDLEEMAQFIQSTTAECFADDIGSMCYCGYEGFSFPLTVDFELTLQTPEGG